MPCYKQSHSVFIHKFNTSDLIDSYEMHGVLALPCGKETIEEHPYSEGDYLEERRENGPFEANGKCDKK